MAARADRNRGLFRRAKAMASSSAKVVGSASGLPPRDGSGDRWRGSPGLTTVSVGLTFRSGEIRTRAVTPASVASSGIGAGLCQKAHPARRRRGTSTPVRHSSLRTAAGRIHRKSLGISELGVKGLLPSESIAFSGLSANAVQILNQQPPGWRSHQARTPHHAVQTSLARSPDPPDPHHQHLAEAVHKPAQGQAYQPARRPAQQVAQGEPHESQGDDVARADPRRQPRFIGLDFNLSCPAPY